MDRRERRTAPFRVHQPVPTSVVGGAWTDPTPTNLSTREARRTVDPGDGVVSDRTALSRRRSPRHRAPVPPLLRATRLYASAATSKSSRRNWATRTCPRRRSTPGYPGRRSDRERYCSESTGTPWTADRIIPSVITDSSPPGSGLSAASDRRVRGFDVGRGGNGPSQARVHVGVRIGGAFGRGTHAVTRPWNDGSLAHRLMVENDTSASLGGRTERDDEHGHVR